jgi:hypothetical protein
MLRDLSSGHLSQATLQLFVIVDANCQNAECPIQKAAPIRFVILNNAREKCITAAFSSTTVRQGTLKTRVTDVFLVKVGNETLVMIEPDQKCLGIHNPPLVQV